MVRSKETAIGKSKAATTLAVASEGSGVSAEVRELKAQLEEVPHMLQPTPTDYEMRIIMQHHTYSHLPPLCREEKQPLPTLFRPEVVLTTSRVCSAGVEEGGRGARPIYEAQARDLA